MPARNQKPQDEQPVEAQTAPEPTPEMEPAPEMEPEPEPVPMDGLSEFKMGRATVRAALVDREMAQRLAEANDVVVRFDPHKGRYVEIDGVRVYVGDWYVEHPRNGIMGLTDEEFQELTTAQG